MEGLCRMKIVRLSNPMESGMIILAKIVLIIYARGNHVSIIFYLVFSSCSYFKFSCKKWQISRSSHRRCSVRKGVLRNFAKFTGKHPCQRLFFNRVGGLKPATLFKKRLWRRCFLVNFAKFLTTPFLQNTSGRLLLNQVSLEVNVKNIFERGAMHFSTETFFYLSYFAQITRSEITN